MFTSLAVRNWFPLALVCVFAIAARGDEPIAPEKAKDFDGKTATVKMQVKSGRDLSADKSTVYLNSEADFKSKANLAIVLEKAAIEDLKKQEKGDLAAFYKGKTIQVTGRVKVRNEVARLFVDAGKDIVLVDEKSAEKVESK